MKGAPRSVSHTNGFVQRRYVTALAVDYCNRYTIAWVRALPDFAGEFFQPR
jgi:hypothetical protein